MNYQDIFENLNPRSFQVAGNDQRKKISASLREAYANGTRTKDISAEQRAKISAALKGKPPTRHIPPIQTPLGLFETGKKAAEAYGTHRGKITHWLKTRPTEFYRVA